MSEKATLKKLDLIKVRNSKLQRETFKTENVTKATKIFHGQENGLLSYFVSVSSIYFFSKKKEVIGNTVSLQCQKTPIHHQLNRYNYAAQVLISGDI